MFQKLLKPGKQLTMWFLTSNKGHIINRQELPLDSQELYNLPDESQPINIWQSLLQAAPGKEIKVPSDEPNIIKEALLDCMEMLRDQDQFVIDAIIYEQITYPRLAERLRGFYATCMETYASSI
jgi:hypothetical protein